MHDDIGSFNKTELILLYQSLAFVFFPGCVVNFACTLSYLCLDSSFSLDKHVDPPNCRFLSLNTSSNQVESSIIVTQINTSHRLSSPPTCASAYPRKPPANRLNPPSYAFSTVSTRICPPPLNSNFSLFLNQPQVCFTFITRTMANWRLAVDVLGRIRG